MSDHLARKFRAYLELSNEERIEKILAERWIGYTRANAVLSKMEDLLNYPQTHRMPNILIVGGTNNGKSTIIERFRSLHPPKESVDGDSIEVPCIYMEMPPEANQDSIYMSILRELHIPFQINSKKEMKFEQVRKIVDRLKSRLLIIDEIHNVLDNTKAKQAQVLNTIKYMGNRLRISIVGAGTIAAHRALQSDKQMANRFKPVELPQWKIDMEFRNLLMSFEKTIPLRQPSNLAERELTLLLRNMSEGWIGELSEVLKLSAVKAVQSGEEQITEEILQSIDWMPPSQRERLKNVS